MKHERSQIGKVLVIVLLLCAGPAAIVPFARPSLRDGISVSQAVYDRNGNLLRLTLSRDEKYRLWLPLKDISPVLIEATLLHEDRSFRMHFGVNAGALIRAVWHTYLKADRRMGGSTITMQLARIRYGIDSRTPAGKLKQILAAFRLELLYSKNEILEAYLNLAPYGLNIEGAGAASLIYFHKDAARLTLPESLTLSVIPQNPVRRIAARDGNFSRNFELNQARERLFAAWARKHPRNGDQESLAHLPAILHGPSEMPFLAPHFADAVLQADPFDARLNTTLNLALQKLVERQARSFVESKRHVGIDNAAVMLVDHRSMEVKALLGSVDFFDAAIQGQVNGTAAKRSPGSAIKPFIYALGIDQGLIHPMTMLKDAPMSFGAYNPENFDNEFMGPLSARDALIRSRNIPAVEIASKLTGPGLHRFLIQAGITGLHEQEYYGVALALGAAEVSMQELAELYSMLANGGVFKSLRWFKDQPEDKGRCLLSKEASLLVLDMLEANRRPYQGYRSDWTSDSIAVAWKTGTSFGFRDAWSMGVVGPYVLLVWVGNFDGEGNPAFIGREAAAPLFFAIIDALKSQDGELGKFHGAGFLGLNLTWVDVCGVSGKLPGPACSQKISTWFIPGKSPIQTCDIHRVVYIDTRTGLRSCREGTPGTRAAVYEFWSSDMLEIFRQAGIPRRVPPPYGPECRPGQTAAKGTGPQITSPQQGVTYSLRAGALERERIPLAAVTDADTRTVYWFVNEVFLGTSPSGESFFWKPAPGRFVVRAVDDQGRADARAVRAVLVE
ncbi:MAG: penicillin-binding protein 1C [Candidatus Krumholzibacteriia bacterium]